MGKVIKMNQNKNHFLGKLVSGIFKKQVKKVSDKVTKKAGFTKEEQQEFAQKADQAANKTGAYKKLQFAGDVVGYAAAAGLAGAPLLSGKLLSKETLNEGQQIASEIKDLKKNTETATDILLPEDELYNKGIIPNENQNVTEQYVNEVINKPKDDNRLQMLLSGEEQILNENKSVSEKQIDTKGAGFGDSSFILIVFAFLIILSFAGGK